MTRALPWAVGCRPFRLKRLILVPLGTDTSFRRGFSPRKKVSVPELGDYGFGLLAVSQTLIWVNISVAGACVLLRTLLRSKTPM